MVEKTCMVTNQFLKLSTQTSVIVQLITGIIGIFGLFIKVAPQDIVIKKLLELELVVQGIELVFYSWILYIFQISSMAITRYYDWFISTPLMLFTTMVFLKYKQWIEDNEKNKKEEGILSYYDQKHVTIRDFIQNEWKIVVFVLVCNLGMLLSGFSGEKGWITRFNATIIGFMFFVTSFATVHYKYAQHSMYGMIMFTIMTVLWAIYGFAYLLPTNAKNLSYNVLDIFAKNFFGIYLYFLLRGKKV